MAVGHSEERIGLQRSGRERKPRNEREPLALTVIHFCVPLPIRHIVEVLDRYDWQDLAGLLDLVHGHLGEPHVANQPLTLELAHCLELLLSWDLGIYPVERPELYPLEPEAPETSLQLPP